MLEFIVLGKIPGTNIFLPSTFVMLSLAVSGLVVLWYIHRPHQHARKNEKKIEKINI